MKSKKRMMLGAIALLSVQIMNAQVSAGDSVMQHAKGNRLSIGAYGEVTYSRNFYSDHYYRYSNPSQYKDDPSNGRFDIPHAVIYMGYDFGKGWTLGMEIEFEHTGTGGAIEIESEEGGEYEQETEKGGEVELEQLWLQKSFSRAANLRIGHIVVPVGLTNAHHEPLNFFTVYRPEGENSIMPCTWHDTGISFWGRAGDWRYELQLTAGLNALMFSRDKWAKNGVKSAFEFKPANKYGISARIDNYTIPGVRMAVSSYFGRAMHNTYPNLMEGEGKTFDKVKGNVWIGSFDFTLNRNNWIVRGQADYGTLSDAVKVSNAKSRQPKASPYNTTPVGKAAVAVGIEAGYDIFSQISSMRSKKEKLYVFGRYEYYDTYIHDSDQPSYDFTKRQNVTVGINYHPLPQIAIKGEYTKRLLKSQFNDEPAINVGIAYEGFFL